MAPQQRRPGPAVLRAAPDLNAGGQPFDLGARSQMVCPVRLGDGRVSLIVGTNDWSDYWPKDVGAWEGPARLPPLRRARALARGAHAAGASYLLRNTGAPERAPATSSGAPTFAAPR